MAYISITSSLSQPRSPSTIGIEQTPTNAHSVALGSVEPRRVYPKREHTPRSVSNIETRGYPKREHTPRRVSNIDAKSGSGTLRRPSKFFIRREANEYVEHVYEGANIRDFFCKLEDCPRIKRCFPSRHRIEKHILKAHGMRVDIPDVRKVKKKVKETKMPGRMEELLKEEAKVALTGYTSELPEALVDVFVAGYMHHAKEDKKVRKKKEGCVEQPIDLCTPTPKKHNVNLDGMTFHAFVDGEDAIGEDAIDGEDAIGEDAFGEDAIVDEGIDEIVNANHILRTMEPLMGHEPMELEKDLPREQARRGPPRRSARIQAMLIDANV